MIFHFAFCSTFQCFTKIESHPLLDCTVLKIFFCTRAPVPRASGAWYLAMPCQSGWEPRRATSGLTLVLAEALCGLGVTIFGVALKTREASSGAYQPSVQPPAQPLACQAPLCSQFLHCFLLCLAAYRVAPLLDSGVKSSTLLTYKLLLRAFLAPLSGPLNPMPGCYLSSSVLPATEIIFKNSFLTEEPLKKFLKTTGLS